MYLMVIECDSPVVIESDHHRSGNVGQYVRVEPGAFDLRKYTLSVELVCRSLQSQRPSVSTRRVHHPVFAQGEAQIGEALHVCVCWQRLHSGVQPERNAAPLQQAREMGVR